MAKKKPKEAPKMEDINIDEELNRMFNEVEDVEEAIDRLFENTVKITSETNKMLDKLEAIGELEDLLTNLIKK